MTPQPTPQTAPRDRRALSHFKHGLTGAIRLFSPAEQSAYDKHCRDSFESLKPEDNLQKTLAQQICDDHWRLDRAAALEESIFAEGAEKFSADETRATGDPDLDLILSQGQTWLAEAKNLNLLTLYESRIHRRVEKNRAELHRLQAERRAELERAIEEAALLQRYAEMKGEKYNLAESFRNFEFSAEEIARLVTRQRRLWEAISALGTGRKSLRKAA
jgi:hypothetical protein